MIPTAIPVAPFKIDIRQSGRKHARLAEGSVKIRGPINGAIESSERKTLAYAERRASVYRMAANSFGEAFEPQFP